MGQQNGAMRPARRDILSRVVPRSIVGQLLSFKYAPTNQSFAMRARVAPREPDTAFKYVMPHPPEPPASEVFIPAHVLTGSAELVLRGCELLEVLTLPDGSRIVRVVPPVPKSAESIVYSVQLGDRYDSLLTSLVIEEKQTAGRTSAVPLLRLRACSSLYGRHLATCSTTRRFVLHSMNFSTIIVLSKK